MTAKKKLDEPMNEPELKPCIADGIERLLITKHELAQKRGSLTGLGHWVECSCGWAGPMGESPEHAAKLWNDRRA